MAEKKKLELNPYHRFSKAEWAQYRDGEPMTLAVADIERLRALTDPISLAEAEELYLPLSRLISFYVEAAQAVHRVSTRFLGTEDTQIPFIIGVAGSVASGKSTTSRILRALLRRCSRNPRSSDQKPDEPKPGGGHEGMCGREGGGMFRCPSRRRGA